MKEPIYLKIKNDLLNEITKLKPHDMIKSERELANQFDASRMTVRKAVDLLVQEGILYRKKNAGTCVSEKKYQTTKDLSAIIDDTGFEHKILYFTVKNADEDLSKIFNVSKEEVIVRIAKSNLKNNVVTSIDDIYYVKKYFDKVDIKSVSLLLDYTKLIQDGFLTQRFIPVSVPITYANILKIKVGSPIIMIESLINIPNGTTIAFVKSYNNPKEKIIEIVT